MAGTITHYWDGTKLVVTSDSGTSSCDLKGRTGDMGIRGCQGEAGVGIPGYSAYQVWLNAGNAGTEEEFLESLIGSKVVSTELVETDEKGGNVYEQTFSSGGTARFTAPKGTPGGYAYKVWLELLMKTTADGTEHWKTFSTIIVLPYIEPTAGDFTCAVSCEEDPLEFSPLFLIHKEGEFYVYSSWDSSVRKKVTEVYIDPLPIDEL